MEFVLTSVHFNTRRKTRMAFQAKEKTTTEIKYDEKSCAASASYSEN